VGKIIRLGRILANFKGVYEVKNSELRCKYGSIVKTLKSDFTDKELNLLWVFCLLSKYATKVDRFNDKHFLVIDINGIKWIIRRTPPISLTDDVLFGPLLSYYQEPTECEWFAHALCGSRGTFVDVGANVGGYSVRACKMGVKVIAVEPDPDNYSILKLNLKLNHCTNACTLNLAAGSREEVRELYEDDESAPAGYTLERGGGAKKVKCYVEVKPLDVAILPLLRDERVNLLKVDVEGFEVEVIKGALELLKRTNYVIVEVIPSIKPKILEVLNLLGRLGFRLIDKICRHSLYCDLFLRRV
jgi:FkbM family methyltransferase